MGRGNYTEGDAEKGGQLMEYPGARCPSLP